MMLHNYTPGLELWDGAFADMPMEEYQSAPGLSSSLLRVFMESPLQYYRTLHGLMQRTATDAMDYGTVAHAAILENRFDTFHVQPQLYGPEGKKWNNNATECKAWNATHNDKPVLSEGQVRELRTQTEYVRNHPKASKLLRSGQCEVSFFANGWKARADHLRMDNGTAVIVDLKTCCDASTKEFGKEILNRGYHIQFAWYRRVIKAIADRHCEFYIIALQKGALPLVNVWNVSPAALALADRQIDDALTMLARCEADDLWPEWPDYDGTDTITSIDVPSWAYPEPELTGAEVIV